MLLSANDKLREYITWVAETCVSEEFTRLKKELEVHYNYLDHELASLLAFQDALYTIIAEQDPGFLDICT